MSKRCRSRTGKSTWRHTLTLPEETGPFPGAVLITGSGPQDRDGAVFGFPLFRVLSDHLTRQGIAVLRYDGRGVGSSTGSVPGSTTTDFAGDALAGLAVRALVNASARSSSL